MSHKTAYASFASLVFGLGLGCSDTPTTPTDASVAITLESIELIHPELMILKGEEIRFGAIGKYSDGSTKNLSTTADWSSSDNMVATIGPTGLAIARGAGMARIDATFEDVTSSATLTVLPSPIRSIDVQPRDVNLLTGETQAFTAEATLADGAKVDVTASAVWVSTNDTVATAVAGLVTAVGPGSASISAADSATGISRAATVTVRDPAPVALRVEPRATILEVNQTQALTATLRFENDATRDVTEEVTWSSSAVGVAQIGDDIDMKGIITAHGAGTANMTARHEVSGLTDVVRVTVNPPSLVGIRVSPSAVSLQLLDRQGFSATAVYSDGSDRPVTGGLTWVSSDPSIVAFDTAPGRVGQAQAVGVGEVTVSAVNPQTGISSDDSGMSATVTVPEPNVTSVIVLPATSNVPAGLTQQLQAFEVYSDLHGADITNSATWVSSDPMVATVDANGLVQTLTEGTVVISAIDPTSGISSDASATSGRLTVDPPVLLSISISPPSAAMVIASTQQFSAMASYSDGVVRDLSTLVNWSVSGPELSISGSGLATAQSLGTVTVSATDPASGISSDDSMQSANVLVSAAALVSIAVSPTTPNVPPGGTVALSAMGSYTNGSTVDVTGIVTWGSSAPGVATVSNANGAQGVVSALTAGSAVITALEPTSGVSSDDTLESAALTVPGAVTLTSIEVTPATATFNVNQSFPLQALGTFSDASVHPMTETVTWSSANTSLASVSNAEGTRGLVTGTGVGTVLVTATHAPTGVSSTTTNQSATVNVEQGIEVADVVHYELDDGAGSSVANLAPNQPAGTINGTFNWTPVGGAPGTSTFCLEMPLGNANSINPNLTSAAFTDLTIDFWWRYVSGPSTSLSYVWNSGISFRAFTGGVAGVGVYVRATPGGADIVYAPNVQTGAWHHFAYVLDQAAGTGTFYVNGTPSGTTTYSGAINITNWVLAGQASTNGQTVNYDRYRVWSSAQTPSQVMDMYLGNR